MATFSAILVAGFLAGGTALAADLLPVWQFSTYGADLGRDLNGQGGILHTHSGGKSDIWLTASFFNRRASAESQGISAYSWYVLRWDGSQFAQRFVGPAYSRGITDDARIITLQLVNGTKDGLQVAVPLRDARIFIYDAGTYRQTKVLNIADTIYDLQDCVVTDLNQDGSPEFVCIGHSTVAYSRLAAFDYSGRVKWADSVPYGYRLAAGQLDSDKQLEIVVSDGQYADGYVIDSATRGHQWTRYGGFGPTEMLIANTDADAPSEIIGLYNEDEVVVFDPSTQSTTTVTGEFDYPRGIALANADNDTQTEVLIAGGSGSFWAYDFQEKKTLWRVASSANAMMTGDVDNDGKTEILWSPLSNTQPGIIQTADLATKTREWKSLAMDGPFLGPALGDVDGDGKNDLVVSSTDYIFVFDPVTHQQKYRSGKIPHALDIGLRDIRLRNVQGDGKLEILVSGRNSTYRAMVEIYSVTDNRLAKVWSLTKSTELGSSFSSVEAVDLDGNGSKEIICDSIAQGVNGGTEVIYEIQVYDYSSKVQLWSRSLGTSANASSSSLLTGNFDEDPALELATHLEGQKISIVDSSSHLVEGTVFGKYTCLASEEGGSFLAGNQGGVVMRIQKSNGFFTASQVLRDGKNEIGAITKLSATGLLVATNGKIAYWKTDTGLKKWQTIRFDEDRAHSIAVRKSSRGVHIFAAAAHSVAEFRLPSL